MSANPLDNDKSKEPTRDDLRLAAQSDALRLLSFNARSIEELRKRLREKRHSPDVVDEVIEALKKKGFLDDAKFAALYASAKAHSRPAGKRRLEADLRKKGLSAGLVAETLGKLDVDETESARELVRRRIDRMSGISPQKKKARLYGLLKRRGFTSGAIFKVMDEFFKGGSAGLPDHDDD